MNKVTKQAKNLLQVRSVSDVIKFFRFPVLHADSELAKLVWLVRLRWMAMVLFFLMSAPALIYGLLNRATIPIFIAILACLFLFNLLTQMIFVEPKKNIGPHFIFFQLVIDLLALSSFLFITGGFSNPFTGLFLLNTSLGGILLSKRLGWPFLLLAHAMLGGLQISFVQMNPEFLDATAMSYMIVAHLLVFSFWMVMRSLGNYLSRQSERQAQSRIQLEKQDRLRALGSLTAGFSHEFASPLNSAKLRLERFKRNFKVEDLPEDIIEALDAIKVCEQVIHQMNSSQIDTRDFNIKSVKIKDLLSDILESWQEENPTAILKISIQADDVLKIAPVNFAQVVINLLDNALYAEPLKEIFVRFVRQDDKYILSIEDQGSGFSDSVLKRIGEPFVTTKENGTGLGLYVTQLFGQSLGGEMQLMNVKGAGARVSLLWPSAQIESDQL